MEKTTLTILLHGFSGHGKSWIGSSAPPPVLVIDLEGRARYLPYENKVYWNPSEAPPAAGEWTHCITTVTKYSQLETVRQWLESGQHPFRSVVLDSISEAQKRFIDDLAGKAQMKDYDWGTVLRSLEGLVRDIRDMTLMAGNPVEVVVVIVGSKVTDSSPPRTVPLLQGQLRDTLPYFLDAVGYIYVAQDNDGNPERRMLVQPTETVVAKDGTNLLGGPVIINPNLTATWKSIKERTAA